ncbi:MAG: translation elongation factor-like protein [bacterium]|nr:translation elongation factor-like protein [bacterium]
MAEEKIGDVEKFFGKISVAMIKLSAPLKVGDTIKFKGHTTDVTQTVDSMQMANQAIPEAKAGDDVGLKTKDKVRPGDTVYKVT